MPGVHRAATHKQLTAPTMSECPNALKKRHRQLGGHKTGSLEQPGGHNLEMQPEECNRRYDFRGTGATWRPSRKEGRLTSDSGVRKMNGEWGVGTLFNIPEGRGWVEREA